jgi:metal-responsive CopG/Arc/MetJ family transcriptional regulator
MPGPNTTKVTVNLPDATVEAIKTIAEERGTTVTEALRQVIESQRFLQDEEQSGNKVLIQNTSDNSVRQVIFNAPPKSKVASR